MEVLCDTNDRLGSLIGAERPPSACVHARPAHLVDPLQLFLVQRQFLQSAELPIVVLRPPPQQSAGDMGHAATAAAFILMMSWIDEFTI